MRSPLVAIAPLLILVAAPSLAAGAEEPIGKDPRLNRQMSYTAERTYLGEVLGIASIQTGVPPSVDGHALASGIQLTVSFQLPARELLGGIRELLTHRYNEWHWETTPDGGYRLVPAEHAEKAADQVRVAASMRFEADLQLVALRADRASRPRSARVPNAPLLHHSTTPIQFGVHSR